MKNSIIVLLMVAAAFIGGCSKDDGGTNAPPVIPEDWTFPADTTEAAGYMYCAQETVAVGASFDVKIIVYNVDSAWAAALEFSYTGAQIEVLDALAGPFIGPDADILTVKELEADSSRASMGVTFKRGTHPAGVSGSGAVMKLKCRGKAAGSGMISINTTKLRILKADGSSAIGLLLNGDLGIIVR
jgi:hypothetical protein